VLQGVLPYVALGYSVRERRVSPRETCRSRRRRSKTALRAALDRRAREGLHFDANRIVVAGASAGGHLALTTGMAPASAGFDRSCYTVDEPRVAAIVDFFGITDIADLLDGPNKKPFPESWPYTVQWLGNQPNRAELAKAASPPHLRARRRAADDRHPRRRRSARALQPLGPPAGRAGRRRASRTNSSRSRAAAMATSSRSANGGTHSWRSTRSCRPTFRRRSRRRVRGAPLIERPLPDGHSVLPFGRRDRPRRIDREPREGRRSRRSPR